MPLLPILLESVMTNGYIAIQQTKPSQANMIIAICSALCWYLTLHSLSASGTEVVLADVPAT